MPSALDHPNRIRVRSEQPERGLTKAEAPGFLLVLVLSFLLWSIGLVDLLAHPVDNPAYAFLGSYSKGVVALMGIYGLLFLVWLGLLLAPRSHLAVHQVVDRIQRNNWLALAFFSLLALAIWHLVTVPNWLDYPGFSTTLFLFLLLLGAILLFTRWGEGGRVRIWRKIVCGVLILLISAELIAQLLALSGRLPGLQHRDGGYVPNGRIYQNREGVNRGIANNFGLHYPDLRLESGAPRTLLLGDTFVQALQVDADEHMGVLLENHIQRMSPESAPREVVALGHPGYGPGLYLDLEMLDFADQALAPQEIIVVMHLGNDLRNHTTPSDLDVFFSLEDGQPVIHPDNFSRWHDVAHYVLVAYEPFHPLRLLKSHYMMPVLGSLFSLEEQSRLAGSAEAGTLDIPGVRGVIARRARVVDNGHRPVEAMDLVETPGWSNYLFEVESGVAAEEAFTITRLLLKRFQEETQARGISLRLATIPVFPQAFFEQPDDGTLDFVLAGYDLLLPETRLRTIAAELGIPMLATGQHIRADGLTSSAIQALYFQDGAGHLTAAGHAYFADAFYDCFYAPEGEADPATGCFGSER